MSVALLSQLYEDVRRIAVAGSAVAPGDFRLKKHIPALEQIGAKAPIFATLASQAKAVVESTEKTASQAVLELASLLNAVLYTQGETATPGPLEEIATTELDLAKAGQISARTLKPLQEALTSTGSGRFELIKDAFERGAFKDPRLVKPSLVALDDGYGEIGDFVAERVLPLYGRAILPDLRSKLDIKGKTGHARRLALLHKIDPSMARPFVEQALESGSKEVKVAAIECLGSGPDDLTFLVEQTSGKAVDVRRVAYLALANIDAPEAVEVLQRAVTGKDAATAGAALTKCQHPKVLEVILATVQKHIKALREAKDKKEISSKAEAVIALLRTLHDRQDSDSTALLKKLFSERADLLKFKGETISGLDVNQTVVTMMASGAQELRELLASSHASLTGDELGDSFIAARLAWSAEKVYAEFSPYLSAGSKKDKAKRDTISRGLGNYHHASSNELPPLHPNWLDAAVAAENVYLVERLGRPGHAGQNEFLKKAFEESLKKSSTNDRHPIVSAMVRVQHPDATDCLIAAVTKSDKKAYWFSYYYEWLIPDLPADAIPKLEAVIPILPERDASRWLDRIEQLRVKHRTPHG